MATASALSQACGRLVTWKSVGWAFTSRVSGFGVNVFLKEQKKPQVEREPPCVAQRGGDSHAEVTGAPVMRRPRKAPLRPALEPTPTGAAPRVGQGCSGPLPGDPNHTRCSSSLRDTHDTHRCKCTHTTHVFRHMQSHTHAHRRGMHSHTLTYTPTQMHAQVCVRTYIHTQTHSHTHVDAQTH